MLRQLGLRQALHRRSGHAQVLDWCERADELALSIIALPELISAFCRLRRERKLSGAQYTRIKSDLLADLVDVLMCDRLGGRSAVRRGEGRRAANRADRLTLGAHLLPPSPLAQRR